MPILKIRWYREIGQPQASAHNLTIPDVLSKRPLLPCASCAVPHTNTPNLYLGYQDMVYMQHTWPLSMSGIRDIRYVTGGGLAVGSILPFVPVILEAPR